MIEIEMKTPRLIRPYRLRHLIHVYSKRHPTMRNHERHCVLQFRFHLIQTFQNYMTNFTSTILRILSLLTRFTKVKSKITTSKLITSIICS